MTFLSMRNWLKPLERQGKVGRQRNRRPDRSLRSIRPRLEALEDRLTPTVFTPTVFADAVGSGDSLRDAIISANLDTGTATDTIQLSAGTYALTVPNTADNHDVSSNSGDLNITSTAHALVIQGATDANGKPTTIIQQTVADRVFQILNLGGGPAASVTFKNLIIEGGDAEEIGSAGAVAGKSTALGGGIMDDSGNVTLSNVEVRSNAATAGANFSAQGGGIYAQDGSLTIKNSVIQKNKVTAGSNTLNSAYGGGVSVQDCSLTISNSTIASNTADAGDGGQDSWGGGVSFVMTQANTATLQFSITNSTVSGNTTKGGDSSGGGVYSSNDTTTITASTLSKNAANATAQTGSGEGGGAALWGNVTIVNSTIAGNSVTGGFGDGGGVYFEPLATGQLTNDTVVGNQASEKGGGLNNDNGDTKDVTLVNTVVAGNTVSDPTSTSQDVIGGDLISGGHNLIGVNNTFGDMNGNPVPTDQLGTLANPLNPKLGPLQNNGGPTPTMLPAANSPLLGASDPTLAPSTDQRGVARPSNGPTDIGSVQVSAPAAPPPAPSPPPAPTPPPPAPSPPPAPTPAPPPALQVPPLLAFLDSLLGGVETVNSNGTETITDSLFGFPLIVASFNSSGSLVSVTLFGFNVTFLFG